LALMKALWYVLTAVFGFFGVLSALRIIERLATGAGVLPAQILVAFVALLVAGLCLRKARGAT
jgi:hypothetical protein